MRHSPGFYRRLTLIALSQDTVRGGLSVLLMLTLALASSPLWLVLTLPLLAYAGLRLLTATAGKSMVTGSWRRTSRSDYERYAKCLGLRQELRTRSAQIDDPELFDHLSRIIARIDRTLATIAEDGKYNVAGSYLDLLTFTDTFLTDYLRVVRRGMNPGEERKLAAESLAFLAARYDRFWEQVNRDAVVNLQSLNEIITFDLSS